MCKCMEYFPKIRKFQVLLECKRIRSIHSVESDSCLSCQARVHLVEMSNFSLPNVEVKVAIKCFTAFA